MATPGGASTRLLFVRHGKQQSTSERSLLDRQDPPLNEHGRVQAAQRAAEAKQAALDETMAEERARKEEAQALAASEALAAIEAAKEAQRQIEEEQAQRLSRLDQVLKGLE